MSATATNTTAATNTTSAASAATPGRIIGQTSDERVARRIAVLLAERRRQSGMSVRSIARSSGGRFTAKQLRSIESGRLSMTRDDAQAAAELYGIDISVVTPDRMPLEIDARGVLSTGGSAISFDPNDVDSLLTNYLRLVRALRGQDRPQTIELRRNDVEVLSQYLEVPGELVVERLAGLMGATQLQRRVLAGMFVAGAMVIGLSAMAAANLQAAEEANDSSGSLRTATTSAEVGAPPAPRASGAPGAPVTPTTPTTPTTVDAADDWRD